MNSAATMGSANSQPRLCPSSAIDPSTTAPAMYTLRSSGGHSRRDPSSTQGQNAVDHIAALPLG